MAMSFFAVSERWAYETGRSHHDRLGRTDVRRGLSDRSGGITLTMSLCLASSTFAICSTHIKNIITKFVHTCHCTRMHRSPAPSRPSVTRWPCQFWADCTTNKSECEFPIGTGHQAGPGNLANETITRRDLVEAARIEQSPLLPDMFAKRLATIQADPAPGLRCADQEEAAPSPRAASSSKRNAQPILGLPHHFAASLVNFLTLSGVN